jgi:hypothetical protein
MVETPLVSKTIPVPVAESTTNQSQFVQFKKCYLEGGTCEETGGVQLISDVTVDGVPAQDGWISIDATGETITINPTKDNISSYVIGVTWTPTNGLPHTYTAFNIVVECVVESFVAPSNPPDISYNVFDNMKFVYMTDHVYTQSPACGYPYTGEYTWTGTTGYVSVDAADTGRINVRSNLRSEASEVDISMTQAVLTIADNNGSSFVFTETTALTFKVTVVDPCVSTTINTLVPDSSTVTVVAGLTSFIEWDVPTTIVDDDNAGFDLCAGVVFEVYTDTSDTALALPWAAITTEDTGKIRLTIDTT